MTDGRALYEPELRVNARVEGRFGRENRLSIRQNCDRYVYPHLALPHSGCIGATTRSEALAPGVMLAVEIIKVSSQCDLMSHRPACR